MIKSLKRLASLSLALLLLLALLPGSVFAAEIVESGTCGAEGGNLTWTLDSGGLLTISGSGAMADFEYSPWYGRADITSVVLNSGVTSIGVNAFVLCTELTSVTIPSSVTTIGESAFIYCSNLLNVNIPAGVTTIGLRAFNYCLNLPSVTIPASVTTIGEKAFEGCDNLVGIYVDSANRAFKDIEGILLSKDGKHLIQCPGKASGAYSIPTGVTNIDRNAFTSCINLTSITIPEGVSSIGIEAFAYCAALTSVTIPKSVTNISSYAFLQCNKLTNVYFDGSKADWTKISIGSDNESLDSAKISFNVPMLTDATASAGQITVKWSAVSGASKYAVYRKTSEGGWSLLSSTVTGTSYTDRSDDLKAGATYFYTVKAYADGGWSGYIPFGVSAKAIAANYPVLTSANASAGQITVKWSAFSSASKYAVYRKTAGESSWTRLTNSVTSTSYADKSTDLKAGTTYYYTVRAYVGSAWSGYDTTGVSAKAVAAAATYPVLTSATASAGQITVKWSAFSSASKYAVYRKTAGESSWTRLTNSVTGTSYIDKSSDLKAGTTYYYTVRAYVGSTWGGYDTTGVSAKAQAQQPRFCDYG